jgi:hypothetical protein
MDSTEAIFTVSIPTQGINLVAQSNDDIQAFLDGEIEFYNRLNFNGVSMQFAQAGFGSFDLTVPAVDKLTKMKLDAASGKFELLKQYQSEANSYLVLVGAGPMGKRVEELKARSVSAAAWVALIFSTSWARISHPQGLELTYVLRSIAFANPAVFGYNNLVAAERAMALSENSETRSVQAEKKLNQFIEEKTALFSNLEALYRKQLTLQEPAVSWEDIAKGKTRVWIGWLLLFAAMVIAPIIAALLEWEVVSSAIGKITAGSNGGFSISGLAVISVPALFYAWLLKNVSRVFIQNLNLADDAAHRRSLALTYMGLLQDEKHPASDQERAIVLNALFRPIPPQTSDEGPPAGLLDLIRK